MNNASTRSRIASRIARLEQKITLQERLIERTQAYESRIDWSQMSVDERGRYDDLIENQAWDLEGSYWELGNLCNALGYRD